MMMDWFGENKTWLFSGIGTAILVAIFTFLKARSSVRKNKTKVKGRFWFQKYPAWWGHQSK
jgi:hypothetical protein